MQRPDRRLVAASDIPAAIGLLTRLPVRVDFGRTQDRGAASAWAYPLAGALIGAFAAAAAALATWLGLNAQLGALAALATAIIITGALHEDGLADSADGLWGGWDPEHRLKIMKDSGIGAYGTLALILSVGARWAALTALIQADQDTLALIATGALSRAPMPLLMHALPNARETGLSASTGRPGRGTASLAAALGLILAALTIGASTLPAALLTALTGLAAAAIAKAKIQGQTGDILGATQQLAEIVILATLTATLI